MIPIDLQIVVIWITFSLNLFVPRQVHLLIYVNDLAFLMYCKINLKNQHECFYNLSIIMIMIMIVMMILIVIVTMMIMIIVVMMIMMTVTMMIMIIIVMMIMMTVMTVIMMIIIMIIPFSLPRPLFVL
jgi:hypothetical protein